MDRMTAKTAETGKEFVMGLFNTVMGGGESSLQALEELSGIAMGGHEQARGLIAQIDEAVAAGDLRLPKELSLTDAARVMQAAEQKEGSGVPNNAWSKADQERMAKGEMPQGHPEHPNV